MSTFTRPFNANLGGLVSNIDEITLGRTAAGLNAYSKGVALGLFEPPPQAVKKQRKKARPALVAFRSRSSATQMCRTTPGASYLTTIARKIADPNAPHLGAGTECLATWARK